MQHFVEANNKENILTSTLMKAVRTSQIPNNAEKVLI